MGNFLYWPAILVFTGIIGLRCSLLISQARYIHRPDDPNMAEIRTRWLDDSTEHSLKSYEFEESTIFKLFDLDHFMKNLLPRDTIPLRNDPEKTAHGALLDRYIAECLDELQKTKRVKKSFKNFTVLKKNNFDFKKSAGLIIFKPKHPPYDQFVVKLFSETPHRFVRPFKKDLEQNCLFTMGGGISRYLVGFTRIKNLNYIKHRIENNPYWSTIVGPSPRKWFWLPSDARWFEVKGYKLRGKKAQSTKLPSIYAIVSDAIEAERVFSIYNEDDRTLVLSLAHWLGERLDPNISNYMIEKQCKKVVLIDTEHFPTNLGLRKPLGYTNYSNWYFKMVKKYLQDNFLRTKKARLAIRDGTIPRIMQCTEAA